MPDSGLNPAMARQAGPNQQTDKTGTTGSTGQQTWIQDARYRILNTGYKIPGSRIQDSR